MKSPIDLVRRRLLAGSAVTTVVAQRVYLLAQPQGAAVPNIIVYPVGASPDLTLDVTDLSAGFRVSVECRSNTVAEANTLGASVITLVNGFQGTIDGAAVDRISYAGEAFIWQDDAKLARRVIDFMVFPA